jgi:hypothetical protein
MASGKKAERYKESGRDAHRNPSRKYLPVG